MRRSEQPIRIDISKFVILVLVRRSEQLVRRSEQPIRIDISKFVILVLVRRSEQPIRIDISKFVILVLVRRSEQPSIDISKFVFGTCEKIRATYPY